MLCRRCSTEKPEHEFHPHKAFASGRSTWCRECHRDANREWYAVNKAKRKAQATQWRKGNPDATIAADRRYKAKNAEKLAAASREWGKLNKDKRRVSTARRKARRLQATPAWACQAAIRRIYRLAHELQELTGVSMHVDHVVPLQHDMVCGLHCEANLQIIPARFNEAKKNYWWPHMFDEVRKAYAQPDMFVPRAPEPVQEPLFGEASA